jgi:parallel beta-helix repeat protein
VYVKDGTYNYQDEGYESGNPIVIDKPLTLIGEDSQKTVLAMPPDDYDYSDVFVEASNVTISNFTINGPGADAISLEYSYPYPSNISIIGNNLINAGIGISTWGCENYFISDNTITGNIGGIICRSSNSTISGNNVNTNSATGIGIINCQNVTVKNNNISGNANSSDDHNNEGGLYMSDGGPYYVYGNSIIHNAPFGLTFYGCNNSVVYNNNIMGNQIGIDLINYTGAESWSNVGSGNEVYNNNLVGNSENAAVGQRSDIVSWDNGYVGNYWSDYQTNYPNASEIGDSGIWNTPYVIDASNIESYPLINQVNIGAPVPTPTPAPTPTPIPTSSPTSTPVASSTPSPSTPEFPRWIVLPLVAAATLLTVLFIRRRNLTPRQPLHNS